MGENGAWSKIWESSGVSRPLPPPSKALRQRSRSWQSVTENSEIDFAEVAQTIVLHSNTQNARQRAEDTLRRSGFDRSEYELLPTVDVRRLVADENNGADESQTNDSRRLKCPARSEWLRFLLSSQALLALQMGKETPYDIDSLDSVSEFLTHIAVWKHIVKHRVPYTLVVDGATFDSPYEDVPQRVSKLLAEAEFVRPLAAEGKSERKPRFAFDTLFLSYKQAFGAGGTHFVVDRIRGANTLVRYGSDGCMLLETSVYLVSLDGAQKLLDRALPIETRLAPFMFMLAKVDDTFRALLAQPPIAKQTLFQTQHAGSLIDRQKNNQGESVRSAITLDDLALMMSRRQLIVGIAVLTLFCILSVVAAIVVFIRSRRQLQNVPAKRLGEKEQVASRQPNRKRSKRKK